ncbi:MAG: hypothetical protein GY754_15920 [bacterium]|nr:hypothetical protein [bacterium]
MKRINVILIIGSIVFSLFPACSSGDSGSIFNSEPIAKAGDEIITKGFLTYTMQKLDIKKGKGKKGKEALKGVKKEVLYKVIENILIARQAEIEGLDKRAEAAEQVRKQVRAAKKEYTCECLKFDDCDGELFKLLKKEYKLNNYAISWEKVFIKIKRTFIPFGGKIPQKKETKKGTKKEIEEKTRKGDIHSDYASSVIISTSKERTTLLKILEALNADEYNALKTVPDDKKDAAFRSILVNEYLNDLAAKTDKKARALWQEVELRVRQNILVEAYQQYIGFESISGGRQSRVVYEVTKKEARDFYDSHKQLFEEPVWVELSHIRCADYPTAEQVRKHLLKDPAHFCDLAKKHSIAPDAKKCGYIGKVTRQKGKKLPLYKEFGFTLAREGQLSIPFQTPQGSEVLMLHKRGTKLRLFDDGHTQKLIREKMQPLKREEKLARVIRDMKKKHPIEIYTP